MKKSFNSNFVSFFRVLALFFLFFEISTSVFGATIAGGTKLYLKPNSNWSQANARFAMYLCNGSSAAKWYSMSDGDGDGIYSATVSDGESHANVIFCRMNPSSTTNDWNNRWNSTCDLTYDGTNNYYDMSSSTEWGKGNNDDNCEDLTDNNKWSTYSAGGSGDIGVDCTTTTIYFKNTVGWSSVYAYLYNGPYWDSSNGSGSNGIKAGPLEMKSCDGIGGKDAIYSCTYSAGHSGYISFTEAKQENYNNFNETKAAYRGDLCGTTGNMFVPSTTSSGTYNGGKTTYYNNGSWEIYDGECSGGIPLPDKKRDDCSTIEIYSKYDYRLYAFDGNAVGPGWDGTEKGESVTYNGSTYYKWTICKQDQVQIIFQNGERSKQTGDSPKLYGGYAYIFDNVEVVVNGNSNPVPTPTAVEEVDCLAISTCYNFVCEVEDVDVPELPAGIVCDENNKKVLFFEDFGTLSGEKSRKQNNTVDSEYSYYCGTDLFVTSYKFVNECDKIKYAGDYAVVVNPKYSGCTSKDNESDYEDTCYCGDGNTSKLWYKDCGDHTGTDDKNGNLAGSKGGMLQFDCRDGNNCDVLYQRTLSNVCEHTYLNFSAWITKANVSDADPIKARFILRKGDAEGEIIGKKDVDDINLNAGWVQISAMFNTGTLNANKQITVQLINLAPYGQNGNDILLDDLELAACTPKASLVCSDGVSTETTILAGTSETLTSHIMSGIMEDPYYLWLTSEDINADITQWDVVDNPAKTVLTVTPTTTTYYKVIISNTKEEAEAVYKKETSTACGMHAITNTVTVNVDVKDLVLTSAISDGDICVDGVDNNVITLTLKNPRLVTATNVKVALANIENLNITKVSGVGNYSAGEWTVGDLAADATASIVLSVKSNSSVSAQTSKVIGAYVSAVDSETYDSYDVAKSKTTSTLKLNPVPAAPAVTAYDKCATSGEVALSTLASGTNLKFYLDATLTTRETSFSASAVVTDKKYYVTQKNTYGCTSPAATISVTVKQNPTLNSVSLDKTAICATDANSKAILTYNISGGLAPYTLYIDRIEGGVTEVVNPNNLQNSGTYSLKPSSDATYKFTKVVDANGCESTSTKSVSVDVQEISVTANISDERVCADKQIEYKITATGENLNYKWFESTNNGSTFTQVGTNSATYTTGSFSMGDQKQYKVQVYQNPEVCAAVEGLSKVTVSDCSGFELDYSAVTSATICKDDNITLKVTLKNNANENANAVEVKITNISNQTLVQRNPSVGSYNHTTGIWSIQSLEKDAIATLTLKIKGVNVVTNLESKAYVVKSGSTTYTEDTTKALEIETITVKDITAAPTLITETYKGCPEESMLNLNTQVSSDATNLKFYTTETGSVTATQANKNTIGTTSYWVSNTEAGKCESPRTKLDIVVFPQPKARLSGNSTICKSESANLNIQLTGTANYIITLSNGDVKRGVSENTTKMTVSPDATTTYTIRSVTDGNGCEATTSGSAKVTVNEQPVIEFTENPLPEYCAGVEYTLQTPTVDNKGAIITESGWYLAGVKLTNNKIKFTTEDDSKSLVYKAKNSCGETAVTFVSSLNVQDCAQLTLSYQLDKSSYCEGDDAVLTATLYNGSGLDLNNVVVKQSWAGKQTSVLSQVSKGTYTNNIWTINKLTQGDPVTLTISFTVEEEEVFEIYVSAANGETYTFDNSVAKSTQQLVVKSYSANVSVNNYAKCPINANSFLITDLVTSDKNDLKVWTKNAATGLYERLDEVPTIDPKQTLPATTYYITNTERGKCESTTPTPVTVEVFPQPTATLSGNSTICKGESANLNIQLTGAENYKITLSNGNVKQGVSGTSTQMTVYPNVTTTYTISSVTDGNGCSATLSGNATVTVNSKPVITLTRVDLGDFCPGDVLTLPANVEVEDNGATITSQGWLLNGVSTTSPIELNASHNNAVIKYTATNECGTATAVEYATLVVKEISGNVVANNYISCPVDGAEFPITDLVTSNKDGLKVVGYTEIPMVNPSVQTTSTTYYITNIENGKCESTTPTPVTVEVYKPVSASISAPEEVCYGSYSAVEISLDGVAPYTVVYNNGTSNVTLNNITSSEVSVNDALYTTTTYSLVSVTDDNGCEAPISSDDKATITVNELPTIASLEILDEDGYICEGTTTKLIATFTGNAPFTFTINDTEYPSNTNVFEMEIFEAGRYVLTDLVDSQCSAAADTQASVTLNVENNPVLTVQSTVDEINCSTETATITASGAYSYSWTDNKGTEAQSGASIVAKRTGSETIYTVVGTSEHGCVSESVSVTVTEDFVLPYAEIQIQKLIIDGVEVGVEELNCTHQRIVLEAITTNSEVTINEYSWSTGADSNTTGITEPGKYELTVTGENGCTYDTNFTVKQNVTKPDLTLENIVIDPETGNEISTLELTCKYTDITLSVESTNAADTEGVEFKWYDTQDFDVATPLTTGATYTINAPAEYIVVAKGGNGCREFKTFDITEDKTIPTVTIAANADIITCSQPKVDLTATSDLDATFKWNDVNNTEGATLNVEEGGAYEVVATAENGCINTASYTVEQYTDLPVVKITSSEEKVTCKPNVLTASGANSYVWSTGSTNASIEVTAGDTYEVTGTNEYGCEGKTEITLQEDKLAPAIKLTSDTTTVTCRKQTALLTAEVTNHDGARTYSYTWEQNNNTTSETTSTFNANAEATYKVIITDETNACSAQDTIVIKENKQLPTISTQSLAAVCLPATVDIAEAVTSTNADNLKYYADAELTAEVANTTVEAAKDAVYYVVGYEVEGNGCITDPIEIKVNIKSVSTTPVVKNYNECVTEGYKTLSSLVTSDSTKLVFYADETSTEPIENKFDASAENTETSYWVSNTEANSCESERSEIVVNIAGYIDFSVEASDTRLPAGQEITITVTPLTDTPVDEYVWYRGEEIVQSTDELELTEQLYLNEKYSVQAVGRCNSPKKEVDVEAIWPTAFTPHNGNGKNDSFADGMEIIVFNRHYTKIYEGNDGWDGSINGTLNDSKDTAVPGVYYYSVKLPNGLVKKGTIEIVKVD